MADDLEGTRINVHFRVVRDPIERYISTYRSKYVSFQTLTMLCLFLGGVCGGGIRASMVSVWPGMRTPLQKIDTCRFRWVLNACVDAYVCNQTAQPAQPTQKAKCDAARMKTMQRNGKTSAA